MTDSVDLREALESRAEHRAARRDLFRAFVVAGAGAAGFAYASAAQAQATVSDPDILNFALNLEYLEANFYSFAAFGRPIDASLTGGTGAPGAATGGRAVDFSSDPVIGQIAREIATDEIAHVAFLRRALGSAAVAQPTIDLGTSPTGAFSTAARAATFLTTASESFDPYAGVLNFLYGAFIFEDVGVTAYKGASPLISSKTYLDAAAGILAAEAYHAGIIRTEIDRRGGTPGLKGATVRDDTELVSTARDTLDGTSGANNDLDQGLRQTTTSTGVTANIVPTDTNGIAFSRSTGQVLNIVYLNRAQVTAGGFFPNGVNGTIRSSANSAA
jgi:hypothetical protein